MTCIRQEALRLRAMRLASLVAVLAARRGPERKPQYGGTLEIGTVYVTLSALSWDPQDWNWKLNHDTGMYYEQLFAADLDKSVRKGGKYKFFADAWLPSDAIRGELVERWEWKENPLSVVLHLRKGVMFPDKPGVMKARELTAEDVVFSYDRLDKSPKKIPTYFDHIAKVEARDKHTVVFTFKEYNAEWDYRFGWGYYSAIVPKEMAAVDPKNWKNAVGTGPFQLADFVQGNSQTYVKNPSYWDTEKIGGDGLQDPVRRQDGLPHHQGRGHAAHGAAHRQARHPRDDPLDRGREPEEERAAAQVVEVAVDERPVPRHAGRPEALRRRPRAPRAQHGGQQAGDRQRLLRRQRRAVRLPDASRLPRLLRAAREDAGVGQGALHLRPGQGEEAARRGGLPERLQLQGAGLLRAPDHMDLLPLVAGYLEKIGVKLEIQPMEYGAFLSAMTTKTNAPGYFMNNGHTNPTAGIRKSFVTGQTWNPSQWSDPAYDRKMDEVYRTRDEAKRQQMLREMTVEILDKAPYVWLPDPLHLTPRGGRGCRTTTASCAREPYGRARSTRGSGSTRR